jgi:acyl-CoA synthetase (AMP-forming)/AMP-acid ligase II
VKNQRHDHTWRRKYLSKVIEEFFIPIRKLKEFFGIPDEKYGEQVCVWIQMHDKSELTALEIKEYCRKNSPLYHSWSSKICQ